MRRLTCWARKDDSSGEWRVNENGTEYTGPHVDRLAEIENILCDDEYEKEYDLDRLRVMMQQRLSLRDEVAERFHLTKNIPLDRLRELITADRDKRCVILPVKPGGTVRFAIRGRSFYLLSMCVVNVVLHWNNPAGAFFPNKALVLQVRVSDQYAKFRVVKPDRQNTAAAA